MKISINSFYKKFIVFIIIVASFCYEIHIFKYYSLIQMLVSAFLVFLTMIYFKYDRNSELKKCIHKQPFMFMLFYFRIVNTFLGLLIFGYNSTSDLISSVIMLLTTYSSFYILPSILKKDSEIEKSFINIYIYICVILSVFSLLIKLNGGHFLVWNYVYVIRDASIYYDPNFLAMVLGSGATLTIMRKFKSKTIKFSLLILMFLAIYFTGSRGTLLSLMLSFFIYLIICSNIKFYKKIFLTFILLIITVYGINYLYAIDFFRTYQGSNNRFEMWLDGIKLSLKSPLIGYGYGSIDNILKSMNYANASTHNSFLDFLLIYGYPSFIIYVIYIFKILAKSLSQKTNKIYVLTIIFMLINANTILYSFGGVGLSSLMFTIILGLLNYESIFRQSDDKNSKSIEVK